MFDLVIRNGLLVDGTGSPARHADIAIEGDRIVAIGTSNGTDDYGTDGNGNRNGDGSRHDKSDGKARLDGPAKRTIDAEGCIVTPGWVDIHTHYDGQVTWDADVAPSSINGVTSIVMGNCGVGFAPAHPDKHDWLIALLEGVEDIPGTALAEGLPWGWESFPEYLDVLDKMSWTVDVGTQVAHAALRTYVMGERGADHTTVANAVEIEAMSQLTEQAIRAGALGVSTSRSIAHRSSLGENIGTLSAAADEVLGIAAALRRAGSGVVQLISDVYQSLDDDLVRRELDLLGRLALETGRPMSFTVMQKDDTPDRFRQLLSAITTWNAAGATARAQVAVRPVGALIGLGCSSNPLNTSATYRSLRHLPVAERARTLQQPDVRAKVLHEQRDAARPSYQSLIYSGFHRMYPLTDPVDYEPTRQHSIAALAESQGRRADEVLYDQLMADNGSRLLYVPLLNYADHNLDAVREMMSSPFSLFGLSDAGAHCNTISDGSFPTTAITHWTRDRIRGEKLGLEYVVHQQTQRTAAHVGWTDRGLLAPGFLADVNVIDHDRLALRPPHLVADLPAGGTRLMQPAVGYVHTIKRGVAIAENGELTGAQPGRLMRGPQKV